MTRLQHPHLGIMFRCQVPPEQLVEYARRAEAVGFEELWIVEDCFFAGGIASVATALHATTTIKIGLGILPAVVRNPAFAAMELATLARLHPGRLIAGFGHGVADWMRQTGAFPPSQVVALQEVTTTVRRLLHGEEVTFEGSYVHLDHVQLEFPPQQPPPILLGVRGPRSLALAGQIADGTILAERSSPAYITWVHQHIVRGQREAGRTDHHQLIVYTHCCIDADPAAARQRLRKEIAPVMATGAINVQLAPMGILPEVEAMVLRGGADYLAEAMPDEWLDQLAVVGTPDDARASIERLAAAGVDSVVLVPLLDEEDIPFEQWAGLLR